METMPEETVVSSPAPAGDSGGGAPSEDSTLESFVEGGGDEAPVESPTETPSDSNAVPVEETVDSGEEAPVEETPVEDPNAPVKAQTPAEKAADETLKKAYRENYGQIKEVLKQHPQLRSQFFKAAELNQLYPTVEDAKQAKDWANQLYQFDNLYYSAKPEDTRGFLTSLYENSKEEDGSAPAYDRMARTVTEDVATNLAARIQQNDRGISEIIQSLGINGKQAMVAVQVVAAMAGINLKGVKFSGGAQPTGSTAATMSEREQHLASEVARLNAEINDSRQSSLAQTEQSFYNGIHDNFHQKLSAEIDKRLEPATALKTQKPFYQAALKSEISNRIKNAVRSDEFFARQLEAASRSGNRGQDHQQRMLSMLEQRARHYSPDIIREVLAEAGITIQQKTNAAGTRAGTPRREPATGGTPGRLSKPGTPASKRQPGESYDQYSRRLLEIE